MSDNAKSGQARRLKWTPELIARLGTVPDKVLAAEIGCDPGSVRSKRLKLHIDALHRSSGVVVLRGDAITKLEELAPLLAAEFRARGLPIARVELWQAAEWAINQALAIAKRSNVRALYDARQEKTNDHR